MLTTHSKASILVIDDTKWVLKIITFGSYHPDMGSFADAQSVPEVKSVGELENIYRVQHYLLEHLDAHHSLLELAHLAHTNRNKLNRLFQALFGMSVFDWLREQRLQKAAELLRTTSLQIQEIGRSVGYANQAHFTTQFKQRFQVPPRQYKNNID